MPELRVDDFCFNQPLGCPGAELVRLGRNHFQLTLPAAPHHPEWPNKPQFKLTGAAGCELVLDVRFPGGSGMALNEYFLSFSGDGRTWQPVHWERGYRESPLADTLRFPTFTADEVIVGHQVPLSFEDSEALIAGWAGHPAVTVTTLGRSLGGRPLRRVTVTAPDGPFPPEQRWVHYIANQHPGEHNAQWRMIGMLEWLLSDAGRAALERQICHFVIWMSPDAPRYGWYRVNAQGVDMNRSYQPAGADEATSAHEAFLCQRDLEGLMASTCPVTTVWGMHTWGGITEPLLTCGPEFGAALPDWTALAEALAAADSRGVIKPLAVREAKGTGYGPSTWTGGPHAQFGVTAVLCEGGGGLDQQADHLAAGQAIMAALDAFYQPPRPPAR